MTLYWFLLVVSSLAFGSLPAEAVPLTQCLGATAMTVAGWSLLVQVASSVAYQTSGTTGDIKSAALFETQLQLFRWLGLVVSAVCLVGFRLASAVATWPIFESSMTLRAIVLLAPALCITVAVWLSEHRYGVAMGYTSWAGLRTVREMLSSLVASGAWILGPVFVVLLITDSLSGLARTNEAFANETWVTAIAAVLSIAAVPVVVPMIVQRLWKTSPVAVQDQAWMDELMDAAGVRRMPVRVWDTAMTTHNALVAGFVPGLRMMVLTDRLLADLRREQVMMVMLHEMAHIKRMHVWQRLLAMIPCWGVAIASSMMFAEVPGVKVISNLIAIALTLVTLRCVAHLNEYEADRWACEKSLKLPSHLNPPNSLSEAAEWFGAVLRFVSGGGPSEEKSTWLHPSVGSRCARLRRWASEKAIAPVAAYPSLTRRVEIIHRLSAKVRP